MQKGPVSVLLCGAGSRGRTIYGQFALDHPDLVRVVGVAEPDPEKRAAVAAEHNLGTDVLFSDWRDIGTTPLAQAVVVATDDSDHLDPALKFLSEGYHLLLEKPMAPNLEDCQKITEAASNAKGLSAVCHVLRYTPYFRKMRELIEQGAVGTVATVRHFEPVNYWHFAHSFVRGNWRNSELATPFILAKCCHDMDILLYLLQDTPKSIQSFGALTHFREESAPEGATLRCGDCGLKQTCPYSAPRFYGGLLEKKALWWPLDVVTSDFSAEALEKELQTGPYGRCVYHCDNNACDHQVVNIQFESGITASFVATAFTEIPARETDVMGSSGMLRGDGENIVHHNFASKKNTTYTIDSGDHHLGGDSAMLKEFFEAVASGQQRELSTSPKISMLSHRMSLLAEQSRKCGQTISF